MEEILIETKRRAETAREFGALGWQKCPLLPVNKQFLKNTLVSTLRSVPDIKKEKKLRDLQIWKNPEHKRNYRCHSLDNDRDTRWSKHRNPFSKLDEGKELGRRFRVRQPDRYIHSRHGSKHSHPKKSRGMRTSKNHSNHEKNEVILKDSLTQNEEKIIETFNNGCKENYEVKMDLKKNSLTSDGKETTFVNKLIKDSKEMVLINDLQLKDRKETTINDISLKDMKEIVVNNLKLENREQNVCDKQLHIGSGQKKHSRSHKRKRSKDLSEKITSKKRKHHSKHKKDGERKHKSKRKSKKHKKKNSEA